MPRNFSFVIDSFLAGMAYPGGLHSIEEDLAFLQAQNISAIVTLTEYPLEPCSLTETFEILHLPVPDFTPPTIEQIEICLRFVREMEAAGKGVAIHCAAGMGRTGTMLASMLVARGLPPNEAIERIRTLRPGSIETRQQEATVHAFAQHLQQES